MRRSGVQRREGDDEPSEASCAQYSTIRSRWPSTTPQSAVAKKRRRSAATAAALPSHTTSAAVSGLAAGVATRVAVSAAASEGAGSTGTSNRVNVSPRRAGRWWDRWLLNVALLSRGGLAPPHPAADEHGGEVRQCSGRGAATTIA